MEKGHQRRQLPSIKAERGTIRSDRGDMDFIEIVAPDDMPQRPDFLTAAGEEDGAVWNCWRQEPGRQGRQGRTQRKPVQQVQEIEVRMKRLLLSYRWPVGW